MSSEVRLRYTYATLYLLHHDFCMWFKKHATKTIKKWPQKQKVSLSNTTKWPDHHQVTFHDLRATLHHCSLRSWSRQIVLNQEVSVPTLLLVLVGSFCGTKYTYQPINTTKCGYLAWRNPGEYILQNLFQVGYTLLINTRCSYWTPKRRHSQKPRQVHLEDGEAPVPTLRVFSKGSSSVSLEKQRQTPQPPSIAVGSGLDGRFSAFSVSPKMALK